MESHRVWHFLLFDSAFLLKSLRTMMPMPLGYEHLFTQNERRPDDGDYWALSLGCVSQDDCMNDGECTHGGFAALILFFMSLTSLFIYMALFSSNYWGTRGKIFGSFLWMAWVIYGLFSVYAGGGCLSCSGGGQERSCTCGDDAECLFLEKRKWVAMAPVLLWFIIIFVTFSLEEDLDSNEPSLEQLAEPAGHDELAQPQDHEEPPADPKSHTAFDKYMEAMEASNRRQGGTST